MKVDIKMRLTDGECEFAFSECNGRWELCAFLDNGGKYVIAYFEKDSEGFYMVTVGDRFFNHDSWKIAKKAMLFLEILFDMEEEK